MRQSSRSGSPRSKQLAAGARHIGDATAYDLGRRHFDAPETVIAEQTAPDTAATIPLGADPRGVDDGSRAVAQLESGSVPGGKAGLEGVDRGVVIVPGGALDDDVIGDDGRVELGP